MKEGGVSYRTLEDVYNAVIKAPEGKPKVGKKAIYNFIKNTNHIVVKTERVPQINSNNLIHRQARYNWFCQLLVRMGIDLPYDTESEYRQRLKPEWIDRQKLVDENLIFSTDQVAWWDEIHISHLLELTMMTH